MMETNIQITIRMLNDKESKYYCSDLIIVESCL